MDYVIYTLLEIVSFALKVLLITAAILLIIGAIARAIASNRSGTRTVVRKHQRTLERHAAPFRRAAWDKKRLKKFSKEQKLSRASSKNITRPILWVLHFKGDVRASEGETLQQEITSVLRVASPDDEVLVRINSTGGSVIGYGLAAAHLDRVRKHGLRLTVAVDEAAASGGYLMAAVANEILTAPFAVIGSIGVIATIPNAKKLLEDKGLRILEFTAGEFKRTVTPFSDVTPEREQKLLEQLSEIHELFKDFVAFRRTELSIEEVATGEYWYGTRAVEKGLADRVITSDEWLLEKMQTHEVLTVRTLKPSVKLATHLTRIQRAILRGLREGHGGDSHDSQLPRM